VSAQSVILINKSNWYNACSVGRVFALTREGPRKRRIVANCTRLLTLTRLRVRGFESHRFRMSAQTLLSPRGIYRYLVAHWTTVTLALIALVVTSIFLVSVSVQQKQAQLARDQIQELEVAQLSLLDDLKAVEASLSAVISEDQFLKNEELQAEIASIEQTYQQAVDQYEEIIKLNLPIAQARPLHELFASSLAMLAVRNFSSASGQLTQLSTEIKKLNQPVSVPIPASVPAIQEAPASGHQRQQVSTDFGTYQVDVIAADLNTTRVQVETASESDCADNCPVASLADFVSRSGGFAGINGPYFCPAEYPSCAGKTNSFDTLLMNRHKVYFNSANNLYSTVPAVIFFGNSARFVGASQEWGRDTSVDAVIAAQPLLLMNGQVRFGGDGDPKKGSRGSRSFIGSKGNTVYIGVVRNATVAEVAHVLKAMGLDNALNLDSGGSTALISGGRYLAGPGRNTPFGIVLVRK
jgi:exopolysaccharide biosynthesis protein